jgi:hypothetical protein
MQACGETMDLMTRVVESGTARHASLHWETNCRSGSSKLPQKLQGLGSTDPAFSKRMADRRLIRRSTQSVFFPVFAIQWNAGVNREPPRGRSQPEPSIFRSREPVDRVPSTVSLCRAPGSCLNFFDSSTTPTIRQLSRLSSSVLCWNCMDCAPASEGGAVFEVRNRLLLNRNRAGLTAFFLASQPALGRPPILDSLSRARLFRAVNS